jgi:hypothetical protein
LEGWIKLYRSLLNWEWIGSPNHLVVFIHMLLRANFKGTSWRGEDINPGQLLTGRMQLSQWTGLSEMKIRTVLKDFRASQEITIKTTKNYSIITILKWDTYQGDIQEITNKQPTGNQQITGQQPHPKNVKNGRRKEGKKNILEHSPLSILFPPEDEIHAWLLTGTLAAQKELLEKYSHHVLAEEIKRAYCWKIEKKKSREAGSFLLTWLGNKKTAAFMPNKAQASGSNFHTVPTLTDHEIELLKQAGQL